jgi:hypothetical protein
VDWRWLVSICLPSTTSISPWSPIAMYRRFWGIGVNLVSGERYGVAVKLELADLNGGNIQDDGRLGLAGTRHRWWPLL